jgi:hypothetical protein
MKFNSQICTTKEQSERLIALGLKKETADMVWTHAYYATWAATASENPLYEESDSVPAWSLGRLIEMLPSPIKLKEDLPTFHPYAYLGLTKVSIDYHWSDYDGEEIDLVAFYGNGFFAAVVDAIEWLIKEGYFNKEYLVNQAEIDEHCKGVLEYLDYIKGEEQ